MKLRILLPSLLLALASAAIAQRNKPEPKILILPIVDSTVEPRTNTSINSTIARGRLLADISVKALESVSPALAQATADVEKIDLNDPVQWTHENFKKLAKEAGVQYVAGIVIKRVADTSGVFGAEAEVTGWLYEVRFDRFMFENLETKYTYVPKTNPKEVVPGQHHFPAIGGAVSELFKKFIGEFPKKPKKKKKPDIIPAGPDRIK